MKKIKESTDNHDISLAQLSTDNFFQLPLKSM